MSRSNGYFDIFCHSFTYIVYTSHSDVFLTSCVQECEPFDKLCLIVRVNHLNSLYPVIEQ